MSRTLIATRVFVALIGLFLSCPATAAEFPMAPGRHMIVAVNGKFLDEAQRRILAELQPGGVVLLGANIGDERQTAQLVRDIKRSVSGAEGIADYPLIYVDQEGGRINRLKLLRAPSAEELGKKQSLVETRAMGASYAREAAERGIAVILAPVLDLITPGAAAIIGNRAFGSDPEAVWKQADAFSKGILDGGALPVAKHFPGHGTTAEDSHMQIAHLTLSAAALDRVLAPFQHAAQEDFPAIMAGHIACAALDPEHPGLPATRSRAMIGGLLRDLWGYDGFIITDDLNMKAIYKSVPAALDSLHAGCDAVMICHTDPRILRSIRDGIAEEAVKDPSFHAQLAQSLVRLERFRQRLGPQHSPPKSHARQEPVLSGKVHRVARGETLSQLAKQYGVSIQALQKENGLSGDVIREGKELHIPK